MTSLRDTMKEVVKEVNRWSIEPCHECHGRGYEDVYDRTYIRKGDTLVQPQGKLIYVASPFSHPDKVVEEARNVAVAKATGYLMGSLGVLETI